MTNRKRWSAAFIVGVIGVTTAASLSAMVVVPAEFSEMVTASELVVHGRVVDAREGRALLELDDGLRVEVQTGPHRIRADVRDSTAVRGTLWFTPRRA